MGICGSKDDPSVTHQSPTGHEQRPTKLEGKAPAVTNLSDRPDQLAPAGSDFQSPPRQADRRPSLGLARILSPQIGGARGVQNRRTALQAAPLPLLAHLLGHKGRRAGFAGRMDGRSCRGPRCSLGLSLGQRRRDQGLGRRLLSAPFALAPFTFAAIHALRSADRLDPIGHFGLDSARRSIWARISSIWRRISSRASLSAAALVSAAGGAAGSLRP